MCRADRHVDLVERSRSGQEQSGPRGSWTSRVDDSDGERAGHAVPEVHASHVAGLDVEPAGISIGIRSRRSSVSSPLWYSM